MGVLRLANRHSQRVPSVSQTDDALKSAAVQSLAVRHRRESRREEFILQARLSELLDAYLDPAVFWTSLENKPLSRRSGYLQRLRGCKSGLADLLVIFQQKPGRLRVVFVELKSRRGVVSKVQKQRRLEILAAGGDWWLARSSRAALVGLHRAGVPFRRRWKPPKLQIWEGPFSSLTPPPPLAPEVVAERRAAKQRWRAQQRERRAAQHTAPARCGGAQTPDGPVLAAARKTAS
jgi:hypothetical protein